MNIPTLSDSAKKVLAALLLRRAASRPELSEMAGLSKQTVSLAIEELEARQLVELTSSRQGHTGRSASIYEIGRQAGWILGVDFGSTHIRLAALTLDGELLVERDVAVSGTPTKANADYTHDARDAVNTIMAELAEQRGPLLSVCVALSRAAPRLKNWNSEAHEDDPQDVRAILESLAIPSNVSFYAENNVNCAVLGEAFCSGGEALQHAAYLQIGVGIGAGIVTDGKLLRGANGMAGELRFLPSPFPGDSSANAEEALSSDGIAAKYNEVRGDEGVGPVKSAKEVFDRAAEQLPKATEVLHRLAEGVGLLLASLVAVANPKTIILGGGIGQNTALLPEIRAVAQRMGLPIQIRSSLLGSSATVTGAAFLARTLTLYQLLDMHYGNELTLLKLS